MNKADIAFTMILTECELALDKWSVTKSSKYSLYKRLIITKLPRKRAIDIAEHYEPLREELRELVEDRTEDLVEAYGHLKVPERKKLLEFVTSLVEDSKSYAVSQKKSRVKPKVSNNKIVSRLKFKQTDLDYKLNSIDPLVIPDSELLLVFNTKTRHLFIYQAKEGAKLSVKGTTLQNYDEEKSFKKTIRKPEDTLKSVTSGTKLRAVKAFEQIKTKPSGVTGRINGDCILLRAA